MQATGIIIGSRAMSYWYDDARTSLLSDIDLYIAEEDVQSVLRTLDHWSYGRWNEFIGYVKNYKLEMHVLPIGHPRVCAR